MLIQYFNINSFDYSKSQFNNLFLDDLSYLAKKFNIDIKKSTLKNNLMKKNISYQS